MKGFAITPQQQQQAAATTAANIPPQPYMPNFPVNFGGRGSVPYTPPTATAQVPTGSVTNGTPSKWNNMFGPDFAKNLAAARAKNGKEDPLITKWNQLGADITGAQQQRLMDQFSGQQVGAQAAARSNLAMRGGATSGSNERLAQQGAWDQLRGASGIATNQANLLQGHKRSGLLDLELPLRQGADLAAAQKRARSSSGGGLLGVIGGVAGTVLSGGNPAGYAVGSGIGNYLEQQNQ